MWKLNGKTIVEGRSWKDENTGISYPANWNRLSKEEKEAIGLVWVEDSAPVDSRFYWSEGNPKDLEDKTIIDIEGNEETIKGLKSVWIDNVKTSQGLELGKTDYRITKAKELSKLVDISTLHHRFNIREEANRKEEAILNCNNINDFISYVTSNEYYKWPTEDVLEGKYVPPVITKRQAFDLMKTIDISEEQDGSITLKDGVMSFIETSNDEYLKDSFDNTIEFSRDHPAIESMRIAFDWTEDKMDDFYISAYNL